jgi:Phytochelatin synthase.
MALAPPVPSAASVVSSGFTLVALNSDVGKQWFMDSDTKITDIVLYKDWRQSGPMLDGPASLALILSALQLSAMLKLSEFPFNGPEYSAIINMMLNGKRVDLTESELLNFRKDKLTDFFNRIQVRANGMTLEQLMIVCRIIGYNENIHYALPQVGGGSTIDSLKLDNDDTIMRSSSDLKSLLTKRLKKVKRGSRSYEPNVGLVVNMDLGKIWYGESGGHSSPIGAIYEDHVLVMFMKANLKPVWVHIDILFAAMQTVDPKNNRPRGLLEFYQPFP